MTIWLFVVSYKLLIIQHETMQFWKWLVPSADGNKYSENAKSCKALIIMYIHKLGVSKINIIYILLKILFIHLVNEAWDIIKYIVCG